MNAPKKNTYPQTVLLLEHRENGTTHVAQAMLYGGECWLMDAHTGEHLTGEHTDWLDLFWEVTERYIVFGRDEMEV